MGRMHNKLLVILISVFSILFALAAAVLLVKLTGSGLRPDKGAFDPYEKEGRLPGFEDKAPEAGDSSFHYLLSARPYFRSGAAAGSIMAENSSGNKYLMKVTYTLKDTGDIVYKSGFIRPGWYISNAPLDAMLKKGIYSAVATITVLEDVTFEPIDELTQEISIYVSKRP